MKYSKKTRVAYGIHKETGKKFYLGDTIDGALRENMMVKDYEKALIKGNPQLNITIKIEEL